MAHTELAGMVSAPRHTLDTVFWVVDKIKSMRVAPEVELEGLDVPEFGLKGYPEDAVVTVEA